MIAAAVVAAVFVLYVATYASIPAGDGYWVLNNIERGDLVLLFNPPSLLTQLGFFGLRRLADRLGLPVETLTIIQTVNALAAGVGAALLYGIVRTLGGSRLLAVLSAALLAVSFGYWYFADGEAQLISLVVLLAILWLIGHGPGTGACCGSSTGPGTGALAVAGDDPPVGGARRRRDHQPCRSDRLPKQRHRYGD